LLPGLPSSSPAYVWPTPARQPPAPSASSCRRAFPAVAKRSTSISASGTARSCRWTTRERWRQRQRSTSSVCWTPAARHWKRGLLHSHQGGQRHAAV